MSFLIRKGKFEMKMKKSICVLAAAVMAASMMTACGETADEGGSEAEPAQAQTASADENAGGEAAAAERKAASAYADDLFNGITYIDQLNPLSPEMVEKVYGISADKYTDGKVYVGGVSTAEEIACFDAVDEAAAADIKAACEARIQAQIKAVEGYNPDELTKLNDPVLVVSGNSVYMCLSNDNAKAKEIIG